MKARLRPGGPALRGAITASWATVAGTGVAASLALAMLVAVCAFVAVAVPRASLGYRTQVLQRAFHAASSSSTTVLADADITGLSQDYLNDSQLESARGELVAGLRREGLPLAPPGADWSGMVTGSAPFSVAGRPAATTTATPQLELLYRSDLGRNATLVSGSLPGGEAPHVPPKAIAVAVTQATAARLGLRVGSRLLAGGPLAVVTGIIRPVHAGSSFWTVDPVAPAPQLTYPTPDSAPYWSAAAFVSAADPPCRATAPPRRSGRCGVSRSPCAVSRLTRRPASWGYSSTSPTCPPPLRSARA
jgi:hypothetical protein